MIKKLQKNRKNIFFLYFLTRHRTLFFVHLTILVGLLGIIITLFRKIRDTLPPPAIDQTKIVGYIQYYGYPTYFDTVIFFILILFPLLYFSIAKYIDKKRRQKK